MDVELHQRFIADRGEAVHLAGFDHEHVSGTRLEGLALDRPTAAASLNELDLVVRMSVRPGAATGVATEQEHGGAYVAVVGAYEPVCAPTEGQLVLSESKHVKSVAVRDEAPKSARVARTINSAMPSISCGMTSHP